MGGYTKGKQSAGGGGYTDGGEVHCVGVRQAHGGVHCGGYTKGKQSAGGGGIPRGGTLCGGLPSSRCGEERKTRKGAGWQSAPASE
jgi:hypothetical protein